MRRALRKAIGGAEGMGRAVATGQRLSAQAARPANADIRGSQAALACLAKSG
jgi:hypothetical protein